MPPIPEPETGTARPEAAVLLENVSKRFGKVEAVRGVSLTVGRGEFVSLLGPSGCGKTTLLRLVAGFETADAGRIVLEGQDVTALPPQRRPTAMVFQSYALFPNMTVGENVAYGLRVRRVARAERDARVEEALRRVDLAGYGARPVTQLSGGQQQRVALARALAVRPAVLLFDEPLSNLDVALREQTRRELKLLQEEVGTTSLYVTHDQQEALALSDRIAVMRAGVFEQVGAPEALYSAPETAFVAQFLGGSNLLRSPRLAQALGAGEAPPGHVLSVRPEHLRPATTGGLEARLLTRQFLGTHAEWWLEAEGEQFRAWIPPSVSPTHPLHLEVTHSRWVREG